VTPVGLYPSIRDIRPGTEVFCTLSQCRKSDNCVLLSRRCNIGLGLSTERWGKWGLSSSGSFQGGNAGDGFFESVTAHLRHGLPTDAERRPRGLAVEGAFIPVVEVGAACAGRLAVGHVGNGRGDRRCDAARATLSAVHHDLRIIEAARRSLVEQAAVPGGQPGRGSYRCRS
jgi:hypothetical protein